MKGKFGLFDYNTERTKCIKRITIICEREIENENGNISTDTITTELNNVRDYIVKHGRKEICIKYGVTDYSGFSTGKKQYNTILEEMEEKEIISCMDTIITHEETRKMAKEYKKNPAK